MYFLRYIYREEAIFQKNNLIKKNESNARLSAQDMAISSEGVGNIRGKTVKDSTGGADGGQTFIRFEPREEKLLQVRGLPITSVKKSASKLILWRRTETNEGGGNMDEKNL